MCLSGYTNALTVTAFIALKHGMKYLMHHPHEPIMYSRKKIHRTEESPHKCYFKAGYAETRKTIQLLMKIIQGISLLDAQSPP